MPTRRPSLSLALLLLGAFSFALSPPPQLRAAEESETDPWQNALNVDYTTASRKLEKLHKEDPSDMRIAVAYAAALLARDPVTQGNVLKSRSLLMDLVSALPTSETQYRPLALYLIGRIDQDHIEPERLDSAREFYEQLRREYPGHELADHGTVQLALLVAMQAPDARLEDAAAKVEAFLPTVTADHAKRELHSIAGNLHWHVHQDAAAALPHLIAGRELNYEAFSRNSEVDIMIAGLAREIGLGELAAKHYRRFAAAVPRDTRVYTALRLARELEEDAKLAKVSDDTGNAPDASTAEE